MYSVTCTCMYMCSLSCAGSVVISAITSCTNTSNPSVMLGAGLLAKKACQRGLKVEPYIKTSLSPGSGVVTYYLKESGVVPYLEQLGYVCVCTCMCVRVCVLHVYKCCIYLLYHSCMCECVVGLSPT